jgi:hypothetical protein
MLSVARAARYGAAVMLLLSPAGVARPSEPATDGSKTVAELVARLASPRYAERERASAELCAREDALPALRRACNSSEPETRRRAKAVADAIALRINERFLQMGRSGRIDLLVDWVTEFSPPGAAEANWQAVVDIGWDVLKRARPDLSARRKWENLPGPSYSQFLKLRPKFLGDANSLQNARYPVFLTICQTAPLSGVNVDRSLVVCAHSIELRGAIISTILISIDDVSSASAIDGSVIVSDCKVRALLPRQRDCCARRRTHR